MVTFAYGSRTRPFDSRPANVRELIRSGSIDAVKQNGTHPSYIVNVEGGECFVKDYSLAHKPLLMIAERFAHALAPRSLPLYSLEPLAEHRADPAARSLAESIALRQWASYGIDAPRVVGHDSTGIMLERLPGCDLAQRLEQGTLTESHQNAFIDHLHSAREAALTIRNPSYFHSDPTLMNAIGSDDGRVWLIDPEVLIKDLPVEDLDDAFTLSYLAGLETLADHTRTTHVTDSFAEGFLRYLGPESRARVREKAVAVPKRLITTLGSFPSHEVKSYARWLSSFDADHVERICARL